MVLFLTFFSTKPAPNCVRPRGYSSERPWPPPAAATGLDVSSTSTWRGAGRGSAAGRVVPDSHLRKAATEYDRKPGITWWSCTEK